MQNHSATHALNAALHANLPLTHQISSLVTPDFLKFTFAFFKADINVDVLKAVESQVLDVIAENRPLERRVVAAEEMAGLDNLVTLPGEVYPDKVTLVDMGSEVKYKAHFMIIFFFSLSFLYFSYFDF